MSDTTEVAKGGQAPVSRQDGSEGRQPATLLPAVDIYETGQGITLWADLPGVAREHLDVKVHDGSLTIDARAAVPAPSTLRIQHVEVREPHFARSFQISPEFDTSKIDAELRDGVLKLTIPRREEARPRRIEVRAG